MDFFILTGFWIPHFAIGNLQSEMGLPAAFAEQVDGDGLGGDAEVKKKEHISTEMNTVTPRFRHLKSGHTTHH